MADSTSLIANITDGTVTNGTVSAYSVASSVTSGVIATSSIITGAKGDKGDTGAQGPAGTNGVTDHTLLTNIGTNSHAQIDTALTRLAATSGTNTGDQDLSGLVPQTRTINSKPLSANVTLTQDDIATGSTNKVYTAAEQTKLAAITGTNTGDETLASIKTKLGITTLSGANTGDQTIPTSLPPNGAAGGDLTGSYPNPTLAVITSGTTVGSGSLVPVITYDSKGRITATSTAAIAAGGTVTSTAVNTANGLGGTVTNPTTTPTITLQTTVTGLVKGNGTSLLAATAGTDYLAPNGNGSNLTGITESQVTNLVTDLASKQPTLVSGSSIKTINGTSLLGSGDVTISAGSANKAFTIAMAVAL